MVTTTLQDLDEILATDDWEDVIDMCNYASVREMVGNMSNDDWTALPSPPSKVVKTAHSDQELFDLVLSWNNNETNTSNEDTTDQHWHEEVEGHSIYAEDVVDYYTFCVQTSRPHILSKLHVDSEDFSLAYNSPLTGTCTEPKWNTASRSTLDWDFIVLPSVEEFIKNLSLSADSNLQPPSFSRPELINLIIQFMNNNSKPNQTRLQKNFSRNYFMNSEFKNILYIVIYSVDKKNTITWRIKCTDKDFNEFIEQVYVHRYVSV